MSRESIHEVVGATSIDVDGHSLVLVPPPAGPAVLISDGSRRVVLVADLHLGKAASFGALGRPIAGDLAMRIARADLDRLSTLVRQTRATELGVLGDLIHNRAARDPGVMSEVASWRAEPLIAPLTFTLVRGNHDRHAGDPPSSWGMRVVSGPWGLLASTPGPGGEPRPAVVGLHEPALVPGSLAIAGHVHPMVTLGGRERSACFAIRSGLMIVPAFGSFTGGASIATLPPDIAPTRVLAVGPGRVIEAPRALWAR